MKQIIKIGNRTISQISQEDGIIEAISRIKTNDKLSFISENYKIGEKTVVYYFCNIFGQGEIGKNCIIASFVEIQDGVKLGNNCRIGSHSFLCSGVTLEDDVFLGSGIITINDRQPKSHNKDYRKVTTLIKKGASIGSGSVIMGGITIGENSMIGAKSLVLKDVPDGELWYGHPAVFIKKLC